MSEESERGIGEEVVSYGEFRTGLIFRDVFDSLKREADKVFETEGRRMYIIRHTVLEGDGAR